MAGYEPSHVLFTSLGGGVSVCLACKPEAKRRNREFFARHGMQIYEGD